MLFDMVTNKSVAQINFSHVEVLTDIGLLFWRWCVVPSTPSYPVNHKHILFPLDVIRRVGAPGTRKWAPIGVASPLPTICPAPSPAWELDSSDKGISPSSKFDNKVLFLLVCNGCEVPCCNWWCRRLVSGCDTLTNPVSLCPSCCVGLKLVTSAVVWIEFPSMNADIF